MAIIPDYDFSKKEKKFFFHHISKGDYWGDDNSLNWIIDFGCGVPQLLKNLHFLLKQSRLDDTHDRIMTESFP